VLDLLGALASHTCVTNVMRQRRYRSACFPPDHSPKRVCNAIPAYPRHRARNLGLRSNFYGAMGMQVHLTAPPAFRGDVETQDSAGIVSAELFGEIIIRDFLPRHRKSSILFVGKGSEKTYTLLAGFWSPTSFALPPRHRKREPRDTFSTSSPNERTKADGPPRKGGPIFAYDTLSFCI
jgi:hypothetical protein